MGEPSTLGMAERGVRGAKHCCVAIIVALTRNDDINASLHGFLSKHAEAQLHASVSQQGRKERALDTPHDVK